MYKKKFSSIFMFLLTFVLYFTSIASADFKIINTDELKAMMDAKKDFILIDTRTIEEYQEAHIINAINIPEKSFEALSSTIIKDKSSLLVLYCSGVKCGKTKRAAKKASELGYNNILLYNEGFPVWEERGLKIVYGPMYEKKIETMMLKPVELKALIDAAKNDYILIDVRDEGEFKEGHIPTAINIPANTIASKQDILPKDKKIIVYCNAGSRSYMAYRKLMRMEYKNINQALFADWQDAKFPVAK